MKKPFENFPCTMCGACCRKVGEVVIAAESNGIDLGYEFPINDDGSCTHSIAIIDAEGKTAVSCEIYQNRPEICRIGYAMPPNMTTKQYIRYTAMHCNLFQEEYEIDKRFRVKV